MKRTTAARICIVTTRNIFDAPCITKYRSLLAESFDIIYFDRCNIEENCGANTYYKYTKKLKANTGKLQKLFAYIGFWRYTNRVLRTHRYDKIIVFPTQAAWLIQNKLCHQYKGKYILDIRDYAGENRFLIRTWTNRVVKNAGLCSITSPAYQNFLPKSNFIVSHNIQPIEKELISKYRTRNRNPNAPITLSFIGSVRFIEQQKKLISLFKNDKRFVLKFIGRGSEQLADFCRREAVDNVMLIRKFEPTQLPEFYMDTDIAINIYGNNDPYLDYALSNKLYSAATMGMPILVSPDTYMAEISEQFGFGLSVSLNDSTSADKVFDYYNNLNFATLYNACDAFMEAVNAEEKKYASELQAFLRT